MTTNPPKHLQTEQAQTPRTEKSFKWLIVFLAIVAVCLVAFYFLNFHGGIGDKGDFGAFGDYFGGVLNPILGFATVGLLVWSLKYQMDELALSRQELALTRQELAETKEETALSRQAMEAQVAHLKQDAKLTELQGVLKAQLNIINDLLATKVYTIHYSNESIDFDFDNILNHHTQLDPYRNNLFQLFVSVTQNPVNFVGKSLEIQILQLGHISLEYSKETNSKLYALPYLVNAISLLNKFYKFQPNESMEKLLKEIDEQIKKGEY
ncbi:hypothetical protein [Shewanella mangrovisoli]|uniref:hypothetical protein n=1 Tax=Shewanella mangrovisoli TaxID=2864211 RepID=UPI0035BAEAF7